MITVMGIVFLIAYAIVFLVRPSALVWMLAASVPFSHTAMFSFASFSITPFFFGAILAAIRLFHLRVRDRSSGDAAVTKRMPRSITVSIVVFAVYSVIVTLTGPFLFEGMPVLTPRGGIDDQIGFETPLTFSISNLAQLIYLLLGISVVLYLRRERVIGARPFELAIGLGLALALASYLLGDAWPSELFDNIAATHYDIWGTRLRGTFPEPSVFGMFLSASIAYLISAFSRARGLPAIAYGIGILVALFELSLAYSGTALVSLGLLSGIALVLTYFRSLKNGLRGVDRLAFATLGVLGIAVVYGATIWQYLSDQFLGKLGTDSFSFRSAANDVATDIFVNSWGIGIGLGSNRPSSFFYMLISCVGIVGTAAFALLVVASLVKGRRVLESRALQWALVATLLAQISAKPDLSIPLMWFVLAGVIQAGSWAGRADALAVEEFDPAADAARRADSRGRSASRPAVVPPRIPVR